MITDLATIETALFDALEKHDASICRLHNDGSWSEIDLAQFVHDFAAMLQLPA